jgi:hypothetical protein
VAHVYKIWGAIVKEPVGLLDRRNGVPACARMGVLTLTRLINSAIVAFPLGCIELYVHEKLQKVNREGTTMLRRLADATRFVLGFQSHTNAFH